jgi:hypothetical protein
VTLGFLLAISRLAVCLSLMVVVVVVVVVEKLLRCSIGAHRAFNDRNDPNVDDREK